MRTSLRFLVAVIAGVLAAPVSIARAQATTPPVATPAPHVEPARDISSLLQPIIAKYHVPGLAAVVVRGDGTIVLQGAAGVRQAGADGKVTFEDKFHLGSCTKAMTATLCAILVQEGTLRWDLTLGEVFPDEFKNAANAKAAWKNVTLLQLCTNRGGVPGDLNKDGLWGRLWGFEGEARDSRRLLLRGVLANEPSSPPGSKFEYANAGFAIAGHMGETKSGTPWEALIQQKLFAPLGITSAGFGAPGTPGTPGTPGNKNEIDQPRGHKGDGSPVQPGPGSDNPAAIGPAGIVHMMLADWGKFAALHLRGARHELRDADPLKAAAFEVLHAVPAGAENEYACGWGVAKRDWGGKGRDAIWTDGRVLTHNGSNTMWFCVAWLAPNRDFAVLVACNRGGDEGAKATDAAAWALIQEMNKAEKRATP